ncbi:hypothetical protein EOD39_15771 [Acipenser ruthenus]|uniref:Uncharacterized protein n=1 Tax=Acipenser ruthenus TaxID=7906 RepID=A0A444V7F8_ACIRT|nr:hypothetical protein EOD39_15771 [Acipenser ruthenus]
MTALRAQPLQTSPASPHAPPHPRSSTAVLQLRESLALLEGELVLTRLSDNDPTAQQLRDQLTQVKHEYKALFRELRAEVKELQQDREILKRELAGVREEMQQRERRHTAPSCSNSMESTLNQTVAKPCRETAPHTPTTPARHADTPTHNADITHSDNTQSDTRPEPEPEQEAAPTPPSRQQHHAEVALLITPMGNSSVSSVSSLDGRFQRYGARRRLGCIVHFVVILWGTVGHSAVAVENQCSSYHKAQQKAMMKVKHHRPTETPGHTSTPVVDTKSKADKTEYTNMYAPVVIDDDDDDDDDDDGSSSSSAFEDNVVAIATR